MNLTSQIEDTRTDGLQYETVGSKMMSAIPASTRVALPIACRNHHICVGSSWADSIVLRYFRGYFFNVVKICTKLSSFGRSTRQIERVWLYFWRILTQLVRRIKWHIFCLLTRSCCFHQICLQTNPEVPNESGNWWQNYFHTIFFDVKFFHFHFIFSFFTILFFARISELFYFFCFFISFSFV